MKNFFSLILIIFAMVMVGCSEEKTAMQTTPVETAPKKELVQKEKIPTVNIKEAQAKLEELSVTLDVRIDDMKEVTYYRCPINHDIHPSIWIIPYVVVDKNYKATLWQDILYVGNEPLYFDRLYIKTASGVENFQYKKIVKSYAGEEYVGTIGYDLYKKLQAAVNEKYAKFRLEGRTFGERELTYDELLNMEKVFAIYEFLIKTEVNP